MVPLTADVAFEANERFVHLAFSSPLPVASSAVLNGGLVPADHLVNLRVAENGEDPGEPDTALAELCARAGWRGTCVGMMTAAPMSSLRVTRASASGAEVVVLVTCGLSNPRRAGDRAEYRRLGPPGTINIVIVTSAAMTPAALIECLVVGTEGKSAALEEAGVRSPVSGGLATGTGTDAIAMVGGRGSQAVRYAGKHVVFGELVGRLVRDAVTASIRAPGEQDDDAG